MCESLDIHVEASDPNQDPLTYALTSSSGSLHAEGADATFSAPAGDYTLSIAVSDAHGESTSLQFAVHVSPATCAVPAAVQDLFVANCTPCHITNTSGGLSLANAEASWANLVGTASTAAACADRVRVVPGDPDASYLLAKLRGDDDICGNPMPRGRPPVAEEDMAILATWIAALPH